VYFRQPLPDTLSLGLQVLQVLLEVGHLIVSGPEPALEAERVLARAAVVEVAAATAAP